ncbi:SAF domain-containing protein, partial [Escherichia coli]|nr:SAF domain-containing protein [Escherichia coli]
NKSVARKSLVAAKRIKVGDTFSSENLTIKRPGNGISPYRYWEILGNTSYHDYYPGDLILE